MKARKRRVGLWITLTAVAAGVTALSLIGTSVAWKYAVTINHKLGVETSKIVKDTSGTDQDTEYYKSDYAYTADGENKLVSDQKELYTQLVREGAVLLKNDNSSLPLSQGSSVAIFGNACPQYITDLNAEMKSAGFSTNDDCWNYYANGRKSTAKFLVNENPWSDVSSQSWFSSVSADTAIVGIGRRAGEGDDCSYNPTGRYGDFLALSTEEKEMLAGVKALKDEGKVKKIIVIINTSNPVSCAFLNDAEYGIDGCVYMGQAATDYGTQGLVEVLDGDSDPSGRLVDTLYEDNQANPVMKNYGAIDANLSLVSASVKSEVQKEQQEYWGSAGDFWQENVVYQEGIYVGYKYAETRYEDYVMNTGNAGDFAYSNYVAYPFGYGGSYTTWAYSDFSVKAENDDFVVSVKVENTGTRDGKHSVLIYSQSPYTDYDKTNGVEKAAVQLAGYTKTDTIKAGESEMVNLTLDKTVLRSYDSNKAKTYILDAGNYYFTVGESSHDAENNILAAKSYSPSSTSDRMDETGNASLVATWNNPTFDADIFSKSNTGYAITNQFDNVDPNKDPYASANNSVKWVSRSDWEGTLPTAAISLKYDDDMALEARPITYTEDSAEEAASTMPDFNVANGIQLVSLRGVDYDNEIWNKLLSQMSYKEMVDFICSASYGVGSIPSIGKPTVEDGDSSVGRSVTLLKANVSSITFPSTDLRAATYDQDLLKKVGDLQGEAFLHASSTDKKYVGLYGFSTDIHRSPYSGRNCEYYSEDGRMAGISVACEASGLQEKGGVTYIKHFFLNDQETYRHGASTWSNEQALREEYLLPFEYAVVKGKTKAFMNSFNRVGMTWPGKDKNAQINFLEKELGFHGAIVTDAFEADYQDSIDGVLAGTTLWLTSLDSKAVDPLMAAKDDPVVVNAVYEAVHKNLYMTVNSSAMNGISSSDKIVSVYPGWKIAVIAIDSVLGALTLGAASMMVIAIVKKHRDQKEEKEEK